MRFKVDENLPIELSHLLSEAGHDSTTVIDQSMSGFSDEDLFSICQSEKRAIVTFDLDFADIRTYLPEQSHGILVFRLASQEKDDLLYWARRSLGEIEKHELAGHLWIVEEEGIRIHGK